MTLLRVARPADAEAIAAIYRPAVESGYASFENTAPRVEEMRGRIGRTLERHPWLVSVDDGSVVGYAYASPHRDRAAYRWSVDVAAYVDPQRHRRGVGRRMYSGLIKVLAAQGFHAAYAGIALPNAASVRLHEAVGFEPVGVYREVGFKAGAWRDVGWWQLRLSDANPDPAEPVPFAQLDSQVLDELVGAVGS